MYLYIYTGIKQKLHPKDALMKHEFGGLWTRKKLKALESYLEFYATALKNQPFQLHYVDAFAGTGTQNPKVSDSQGELIPYEDFMGSVRMALSIPSTFHQYHFNDLNPDHIKELDRLKQENPEKNILIYQQDANQFVSQFCQALSATDRAVLFLDPYSTELDWNTLKCVAETQKIDLWLLFPISVIFRMTPKDKDKIKPEWKNTLDRLLGTDQWENALYNEKQVPIIEDMFGGSASEGSYERLNVEELQNWVTCRLGELFSYVAEPVMLRNNNSPLFLFYFAVSNPNKAAWGLADRAAKYIIKTIRYY